MKKEILKLYTCCFFGHRNTKETNRLKNKLRETVESLIINEKIDTFMFGSKSKFDSMCYEVVTELKEKYSYIRRIYVRTDYLYIPDEYTNYLLKSYEDTYYPEKILNAGRASYVERNYEMIDKSRICVLYYDKNYLPPRRKNRRNDVVDYQPKSGTKLAYDYARRKGLQIVNVYENKGAVI